MSKGAISYNEQETEYYTPSWVFRYTGTYEYDPATTKEQAERMGIEHYDTKETDGLKQDWSKYKSIWINPPFNQKAEFFQKAVDTYKNSCCERGTGAQIISILLPISFLTTKTFHKIIGEVEAEICIPKGRINFINKDGQTKSASFGSVIITLSGYPWEGGRWRTMPILE